MYAIYAETGTYVHLVSSDDRELVVELLKQDMSSVGTSLAEVLVLYAVKDGRFTDIELEDELYNTIKQDLVK